jgi:Raf kinase inhibitor-like YbhB/YbcL family protein
MRRAMMWAITALFAGAACLSPSDPGRTSIMSFSLTSTAFSEGGDIPRDHTCDGANRPVPLEWSDVPSGTAEFALIMDDPDARGFVHWVVSAIPGDSTSLGGESLPAGVLEGPNDFGRTGYGGPCPPSGSHRYQFTLYALSSSLGLSGTPTADDVRAAARGKNVGEARLTGRYTRQR